METDSSTNDTIWRQHLVGLIANISVIDNGVVMGWSSPAESGVGHTMSEEEWIWVSALAPLGAVVGAIPAGLIAYRIGRRDALLTTAVPSFTGWLLITFTRASWSMMLGRTCVGMAAGASTVIVPLYADETASEHIRGIVGVYLDLFLSIGIVLSYLIGGFWSYQALNFCGCLIPVVFGTLFFWMPETPWYLKSKGRIFESEEVYGWLRGKDFSAKDSGKKNENVSPKDETSTAKEGPRDKKTEIAVEEDVDAWPKKATIRGVTIVFLLMVFAQLSGIAGVIFYAERIFEESSPTINSNLAALIVGFVGIPSTLVAMVFVDRVGRRPLLCVSAAMMSVTYAALASCFWFPAHWTVHDWLPVVSVSILIIFFSVGIGPLPWFMMAELLPPQTKSWAAPGAVSINWLIVFAITVGFEPALETFGPQATYFTLSFIAAVSVAFVYCFLPETVKLSPEKIRTMIIQNRRKYKAPEVSD